MRQLFFLGKLANEVSLIYSLSAELGRRRSRLTAAGGLWNMFFPETKNFFGDTIAARMEFNLFGAVGYRYQAPKGFLFGVNVYMIGGHSEYAPTINKRNNYPVFTIWPSVYLGYRIPSWNQHREFVEYGKLTRPERKAYRRAEKQHMRDHLAEIGKKDSTITWRNSEFGLSILGPGLVILHHTLYVPLNPRGVPN